MKPANSTLKRLRNQMKIKKNTTLSEQFQNSIAKSNTNIQQDR
jgi:hypothetical protein